MARWGFQQFEVAQHLRRVMKRGLETQNFPKKPDKKPSKLTGAVGLQSVEDFEKTSSLQLIKVLLF